MNSRKLAAGAIRRFPFVRETLIAIRDHWSTTLAPKQTPFGFKFAGPSEMVDGSFEEDETPIIRSLIEKNDLFINIGANVGYYCCFAAMERKPVIAFEPHLANCRLLLRNLELNRFTKNVEIYPTAVGAENGILKLYGSGTAASLVDGWAGIASENATLVPVVTLDGVLDGRFEGKSMTILIDVEGAEYSVIQGSISTLSRNRKPWWVIEICITDHQPAGVKINPNLLPTFDLIHNAGYEVWTLTNSPRIIQREEVLKIYETKNDTIKYHNFLCIHPSEANEAVKLLTGN